MWVTFEGPFNSGQVSLAGIIIRRITELTGTSPRKLQLAEAPESPETALQEALEPWRSYHPEHESLIQMRNHWTTALTGVLNRPQWDRDGFGDLRASGWKLCEMAQRAMGGVTVVMTMPTNILKARLRPLHPGYVDRLSDGYKWLAPQSYNTVLPPQNVFASSNAEMEELAESILGLAQTRTQLLTNQGLDHHYVGPEKPAMLVVVSRLDRLDAMDLIDAVGPFWQSLGIVEHAYLDQALRAFDPQYTYSLVASADIPGAIVLDEPHQLADMLEG